MATLSVVAAIASLIMNLLKFFCLIVANLFAIKYETFKMGLFLFNIQIYIFKPENEIEKL